MTNTERRPSPNAAPPSSRGRRTYTFVLTPAQLVSRLVGLGIVVIWVFVLGIILGRGFSPETHITELQKIMPAAESGNAPRVITPQDRAISGTTIAEEPILHPTDMEYRNSLKNPATPRSQEPQPQRQASPTTAASAPTGSADGAPNQTPPSEVFVYVYQVAAYRGEGPCDALVAKLKADGINASTEKSEENGRFWYKTLVTFKGSADDVDVLRAALARHGLDRLILRTKTPAS